MTVGFTVDRKYFFVHFPFDCRFIERFVYFTLRIRLVRCVCVYVFLNLWIIWMYGRVVACMYKVSTLINSRTLRLRGFDFNSDVWICRHYHARNCCSAWLVHVNHWRIEPQCIQFCWEFLETHSVDSANYAKFLLPTSKCRRFKRNRFDSKKNKKHIRLVVVLCCSVEIYSVSLSKLALPKWQNTNTIDVSKFVIICYACEFGIMRLDSIGVCLSNNITKEKYIWSAEEYTTNSRKFCPYEFRSWALSFIFNLIRDAIYVEQFTKLRRLCIALHAFNTFYYCHYFETTYVILSILSEF